MSIKIMIMAMIVNLFDKVLATLIKKVCKYFVKISDINPQTNAKSREMYLPT
jgi:hypothetical protein